MPNPILWPTLALVALIWIVWLRLFFERFRHMKAHPPTEDDFKDGISAFRYFAPVQMPASNLANLFEMPVLYFALVPLLLLTGMTTDPQLILAWLFVLFRMLHSFEHIGPKRPQIRFRWYLISSVFLMAMWIGFAVDLVR